jgi:pimeloyl-ACP methyl ester carboxylesterase
MRIIVLTVLAWMLGGGAAQTVTPDVVLISFSGRTGFPALGHCTPGYCPPRDNTPYLSDPERRTIQSLESVFLAQGLEVVTFNASSFIAQHHSYLSGRDEPGYVEAEAFLLEMYHRFIRDSDQPARVVLVGHSHGAVWASLLAWNHPEVPVAYLISLDSVCTGWTADHAAYIQQHYSSNSERYPWPLREHPDLCRVTFDGLPEPRAISDVVPGNVALSLEVQSVTQTLDPQRWAEERLRELLEHPPTVEDVEVFLEEAQRRVQAFAETTEEFIQELRPHDLLDFTRYQQDIERFLQRDWTEFLALGLAALQGTLNPFRDGVSNVRPSGSHDGIFVHEAEHENHSEVTRHTSEAMCWLRKALRALEEGQPPSDEVTCDAVLSV